MKPLKTKVSITLDSDIIEKIRQIKSLLAAGQIKKGTPDNLR